MAQFTVNFNYSVDDEVWVLVDVHNTLTGSAWTMSRATVKEVRYKNQSSDVANGTAEYVVTLASGDKKTLVVKQSDTFATKNDANVELFNRVS